MLTRMTLAAAALALSTPATAACIEGANGAECDVFIEDYRVMKLPAGAGMIRSDRAFLLEDFDWPAIGTDTETFRGPDVLYWDGDEAFVVPGNSGPPIEIADW